MARSFNGTTDLINCGTGVPTVSGAMTASIWVKPSAFPNAYGAVISRNSGTAFYQLFVKSTGKLAIYVATTVAGSINYDPGSHTLSAGTWYNLAFTFTTAAGIVGYVNAASDGTGAPNGGALAAISTSLYFSNDSITASRQFAGSLADAGIWNVALALNELQALAAGIRPPTVRSQSLIGYWPLDGIESPEPDLSGNKANGTLTGTARAAAPPVMLSTKYKPDTFLTVNFSVLVPNAASYVLAGAGMPLNVGMLVGSTP